MLAAPEYCTLTIIEKKHDTIIAIINTSGCWIDETKCNDGYWFVYSQDTTVVLKEFRISNGVLEGVCSERFENGNPRAIQAYKKGKPHGTSMRFDEFGNVTLVGTEDSSRFIGTQLWYWDNGAISKSSTWTEETKWYDPISLYWDVDGKVISEETWKQLWECN